MPLTRWIGLTKVMPHVMTRSLLLLFATSLFLTACVSHPAHERPVNMTLLDDRVKVEVNGRLFTEYVFKDVPRPYFYPLIGPGGVAMTRKWPMESPPGEDHDHPH